MVWVKGYEYFYGCYYVLPNHFSFFEDGVNLYCLQQYYTWITEAHFSENFMSSALFSFDLVCRLLLKIFFQNKLLFTPPSVFPW